MRRLLFWTLLLLFAALTAWWVIYVPRDPEKLYKAVPHGATFVSVHSRMAERWDEVSHNPIARSLLQSSGAKLEEVDMLSRNDDFRFWLQRVASDEVLLAHVPYAHPLQSDVWIIASWLGGWSQRVRWMLRSSDRHDCKLIGEHGGRLLWAVEYGDEGEKQVAQFAFVEGAVIGCVSEHPEAIRYVLDVYDGRVPGDADFYRENVQDSACVSADGYDRGWFSTGRSRRSRQWGYTLEDLGPMHLKGGMCTLLAGPVVDEWEGRLDVDGLSKLVGDLPFAAIVGSPEGLLHLLGLWMADKALRPISEFMQDIEAKAVTTFVLGDEYSGRLKGLKWPGLLIGFQMAPETDADLAVTACLDRMNAEHQWGLIRSQQSAGGMSFYVVESTADTFYAGHSSRELIAYVVCGNWLVFSSNASSLEKLLVRYQSGKAVNEMGTGRWEGCLREERVKALAYGWSDLEKGGKALRLALSAYAVKLMFENAEKSQAQRQRLNEAKAWIDAVMPLEDLYLRVEQAGEMIGVAFELGADGNQDTGRTVR